jgi:hypothetical protein
MHRYGFPRHPYSDPKENLRKPEENKSSTFPPRLSPAEDEGHKINRVTNPISTNTSYRKKRAINLRERKDTREKKNGVCETQPSELGLLDILLRRGLVLRDKVLGRVPGEPGGELYEFLAQAGDGLVVHVCLGDELLEGDCFFQSWLVVWCLTGGEEGRGRGRFDCAARTER